MRKWLYGTLGCDFSFGYDVETTRVPVEPAYCHHGHILDLERRESSMNGG